MDIALTAKRSLLDGFSRASFLRPEMSLSTRMLDWMHRKVITAHLRIAEVKLRTTGCGVVRGRTLDLLRDYSEREQYPNNDRFAKRTPFFRGENGNLCAMGYLLWHSGERDLVNAIAASNNNIYVKDIHDTRTLSAIAALGLTKEEAALIQPTYGWGDGAFPSPTLTPPPPPSAAEIVLGVLLENLWLIAMALAFVALQYVSIVLIRSIQWSSGKPQKMVYAYFVVINLVIALFAGAAVSFFVDVVGYTYF